MGKTPSFKISLHTKLEAIVLNKHFEENELIVDCQSGKDLYISKEAMAKECPGSTHIDWRNDILTIIEDCCMVYEFDYTPQVEEVDFDYEEGINQL